MIGHLTVTAALLLALGSAPGTGAWASDEPDELVPGKRLIARHHGFLKFVASTSHDAPFDLPDTPANDPRTEGATLRVFDLGGAGGDNTYALPASGWSALGNDPSKGFKFLSQTLTEPCRHVKIKERVIAAHCPRLIGPDFTLPFAGDAGVILTVGTNSKRYCAVFGGTTQKNTELFFNRKDAPSPAGCPAPPSSPSGAFLNAP